MTYLRAKLLHLPCLEVIQPVQSGCGAAENQQLRSIDNRSRCVLSIGAVEPVPIVGAVVKPRHRVHGRHKLNDTCRRFKFAAACLIKLNVMPSEDAPFVSRHWCLTDLLEWLWLDILLIQNGHVNGHIRYQI